MRNFRNLTVWKEGVSFARLIYQVTESFPSSERFGLSMQLQRAAVSIASNIAEGAARKSETDFARFLEMSLGSAFEIETQLIIAQEIGYLDTTRQENILAELTILQKRINQLITKIRHSQ